MIQETNYVKAIIWQTSEENGIGEPALLIEVYSDIISIYQQGNEINVNFDNIDELCKLLKQLKAEKKKGK